MIAEKEILETIDMSAFGTYSHFIWLNDVYTYLIDCRLNIFRHNDGRWAIVTEKLGYNPSASGILLEISYYGNCLVNLDEYNGQKTNYYHVDIFDDQSFEKYSVIDPNNTKPVSFTIRNKQVLLSHNKEDYTKAGIDLSEFEPNKLSLEEAGRLMILEHHGVFRATDEELYKSIPNDLEKILVLDQWHHTDFLINPFPKVPNEQLLTAYEFKNKTGSLDGMDFEAFVKAFRLNEAFHDHWNKEQWETNRPSLNETWQLIAKVISTGDISQYKPTFQPNTHWKNWDESGSM